MSIHSLQFPFPFHTIKNKQTNNKKKQQKTEKSLGGEKDGVGKKMSEQAPGYFSFHFTQLKYVKIREKRRKGNIEI